MSDSSCAEDNELDGTFYGCYLLVSLSSNPRYKGRTYIGFTVDPNRRIKQHNEGRLKGGAKKTSGRGPWEMILIIHGFPTEISALRFEWAWQHPATSRRLRHVKKKTARESHVSFAVRVASEMLQVGPWNRLSLTIRWLNQDYQTPFPKDPPLHMAEAYGPLAKKKKTKATAQAEETTTAFVFHTYCSVCKKRLMDTEKSLRCLKPECDMKAHLTCLAFSFLSTDKQSWLLPVVGTCCECGQELLWGDLIRYNKLQEKRRCYSKNTDSHATEPT